MILNKSRLLQNALTVISISTLGLATSFHYSNSKKKETDNGNKLLIPIGCITYADRTTEFKKQQANIKLKNQKLKTTILPISLLISHADSDDSNVIRILKHAVAKKAVDDYIQPGMKIGLGTGSTCLCAVERINELLLSGDLFDIVVVPSSESIAKLCISKGIKISTLSQTPVLDCTIDSADEIDINLTAIKGACGAILREQMILDASRQIITLVDETKISKNLGTMNPLPVEIQPYSHVYTRFKIENTLPNSKAVLRRGMISNTMSDGPDVAVTDNGNFIVDVYFDAPIRDVSGAINALNSTPGVVAHGLCEKSDKNTAVIVGTAREGIRVISQFDESPWWSDQPQKKPLQRLTVDNRKISAENEQEEASY